MTSRGALLRKLSAAQFAMWELHVYLDTHPNDKEALALHKKYEAKASELRKEYEEHFGPLTPATGEGVEWLKNPWPWETEGSDC